MFYKKNLSVPTLQRKKITFNTFISSGEVDVAEQIGDPVENSLSINFDTSSGTLKAGIGVKETLFGNNYLILPEGVSPLKVFYYKRFNILAGLNDDRLVIYADDGFLYSLKIDSADGVATKIEGCSFTAEPIAVCYNYSDSDVLIVSTKQDGLYIIDDLVATKIDGAPVITSACIHSERLFVTTDGEGTSLWFSDDFNPTNWFVSIDQAGFIELPDERGELLKVISFFDYVYVFRAYGISRVTAYGDQSEFIVDNLYTNCGRIYGNTVTECGDSIIFMSTNGIYKFNGTSITKILTGFDKYFVGVDNTQAQGVFINGNLLLLLKMKLTGEGAEQVILVYDMIKKSCYIEKGILVKSLTLVNGEKYLIYAICGDKLCQITNDGRCLHRALKKLWKSGKSDFSLATESKRLYKIQLTTATDITLIVNCDGKKKSYQVLGGGVRQIDTDVTGRLFSFEIETHQLNPEIIKPTFYFSYLKESLW